MTPHLSDGRGDHVPATSDHKADRHQLATRRSPRIAPIRTGQYVDGVGGQTVHGAVAAGSESVEILLAGKRSQLTPASALRMMPRL